MTKRKTKKRSKLPKNKKIFYDKNIVDSLFLNTAERRALPVSEDKKIKFFEYDGTPVPEPEPAPAGYTTRLDAKEMCFLGAPDDPANSLAGIEPGKLGFKFKMTSTLPPSAVKKTDEREFNLSLVTFYLRGFGYAMMEILDAGITNDRQRKALKSLVNRKFAKRAHIAQEFVYGDGYQSLIADLTNDAEEIQYDN